MPVLSKKFCTTHRIIIACVLFVAALTIIIMAVTYTEKNSAAPFARTGNSFVTFYAFNDNDNGFGKYGTNVIQFPKLHKIATEDIGTFDRPSTFAADSRVFSPGEIIYIPRLKKYYVMEDGCAECTADANLGKQRADLYMGNNNKYQDQAVIACEV